MPDRPTILLLLNNMPVHPVIDDETIARLRRLGRVVWPDGPFQSWSAEQMTGWLAEADAVITSWRSPRLTAGLLSAAPRLRFIGHAAGTVAPYVDPSAWQRGITVVSANAAMSDQVAEWAVTLALMSLRRWKTIARRLDDDPAAWGRAELDLDSESLCNQTVGLVGFGQVARRAIRCFAAFNCRMLVTAPESAQAISAGGGRKVDLPELLGRSRVVSLHAPLNEQTRGMIGQEQLAMLADGAVLVNTARGKLLDTAALIDECRRGRIRAALDVTDPEPLPPGHPLWHMDNVIVSPHCAGPVPCRRPDFGRMVADDLDAFLAGRPLLGQVSAEHARMMTRKL